jgi:ComF family protein
VQLCNHCVEDIAQFNYQLVAGDLLNWPVINEHLPNIYFDRLICFGPYLWPLNQWITELKYHAKFELALQLSQLLINMIKTQPEHFNFADNTLVISIPSHITRWQQRGYNQAHLIAQPLAKALNLPYASDAVIKHKQQKAQVGQSGAQRRKNLSNSFTVFNEAKLTDHVILVDDVVTTGATTSEVAKLLKNYGVKTVTVLAVALSLPASSKS